MRSVVEILDELGACTTKADKEEVWSKLTTEERRQVEAALADPHTLRCDTCAHVWRIETMESRSLGSDLSEVGFTCPSCSRWYRVSIQNAEIQALEEERRQLTTQIDQLQNLRQSQGRLSPADGKKLEKALYRSVKLKDKQARLARTLNLRWS